MFAKPIDLEIMQKVGFLGFNGQIEEVLGSVSKSSEYSITGIYFPENSDNQDINIIDPIQVVKNPFGLIAESDLLIVNKTDSKSYNLIVECIQNSRNILISHPENLTIDEVDYLNKLAIEASISAYPLISYKLKYFIKNNDILPLNPKLIRIKSKGRNNIIKDLNSNQLSLFLADIVTSFIDIPLKKINCHSTSVIDELFPLTSLTISFEGGKTAQIEIDVISDKPAFVIEVFYKNQIIEIDLLTEKMKQSKLVNGENNFTESENIFNAIDSSFQNILDFALSKDSRGIRQNHLNIFKTTLMIYNKLKEKLIQYKPN
jgi:hypothetical protein